MYVLFKEHLHMHSVVVAAIQVVSVFKLTPILTIPMNLPGCNHSLSTCVVSELQIFKDHHPLHRKYQSQQQVRKVAVGLFVSR